MGLYSTGEQEPGVQDRQALVEYFMYDELSHLPDDKKQEFLASEHCAAMLEAGTFRKKTLVKLSKNDDLSRRMKMAAFQLAKEKNDPLWDLLVKNRIKERDLIGKISNKYASASARDAKLGQRDYLKAAGMPAEFMRPEVKNTK